MRTTLPRLLAAALAAAGTAWASGPAERVLHTRTVQATAYNTVEAQTDASPWIGAWGDRLAPLPQGVRAIAVSPDLLDRGLKRGMRVRIEGLKGEFAVLDRMPRRWTRRIDICMGTDLRAAKRWGRRWVTLWWED